MTTCLDRKIPTYIIVIVTWVILIYLLSRTNNMDELIIKMDKSIIKQFNEVKMLQNKDILLTQSIVKIDCAKTIEKQTDKPTEPIIIKKDYRSRMSSTQPTFKLYLHPSPDIVSDYFYHNGYWVDCKNILNVATSKLVNISKLVIVEIGTNIGTCTFQYAANGHRIIGFEPFPPSIELFRKNMRENILLEGNIVFIEAGASDKKGIGNAHYEHGNIGNTRIGNHDKDYKISSINYHKTNETVIMTTVDSIVKEHVNLLKIDAQGHELYASMGAVNLLKDYGVDVVVFEFTPLFLEANKQKPEDLLHFFEERNFDLYNDNKLLKKADFESFSKNIRQTRLDTTIVCFNKKLK